MEQTSKNIKINEKKTQKMLYFIQPKKTQKKNFYKFLKKLKN